MAIFFYQKLSGWILYVTSQAWLIFGHIWINPHRNLPPNLIYHTPAGVVHTQTPCFFLWFSSFRMIYIYMCNARIWTYPCSHISRLPPICRFFKSPVSTFFYLLVNKFWISNEQHSQTIKHWMCGYFVHHDLTLVIIHFGILNMHLILSSQAPTMYTRELGLHGCL